MATISEQLRKAIERSGLSSYRLAHLANVPESTLSRFLKRERSLTLDTVDRLCAVLRHELRDSRRKSRSTENANPRRARVKR